MFSSEISALNDVEARLCDTGLVGVIGVVCGDVSDERSKIILG